MRVGPVVSSAGLIHIYADELHITPGGVLVFHRYLDGDTTRKEVPLAIREVNWISAHQASTEDGKPLGVERWKGVQ